MRSEVRRGRKFVEYHDDDQPEGTFTQEISVADVSYQDETGNWLATDENWEADGSDGNIAKHEKCNHKGKLKGNGDRTWYPRRNVETEYVTIGAPEFWDGKKFKKFQQSGWVVEGKTLTLETKQDITLYLHNRWNGVKIDWVLASADAPTRMRYSVGLTGITEMDGVLFGADGERLASLTPTTATDANGVELVCTGSYMNGYVEFSAEVSGAAFPVVIDPDFAAATVDGTVYADDASYATAHATADKDIQNDLYTGQMLSAGVYYVYRSVLSFDTSSIGANTISQVNLKMTVHYEQSATDFDVQIAKYNWSGNTIENNRDTIYDGVLGATADDNLFCNTAGKSANTQYTSGNLSTAWVNKSGVTYYGLRSSLDVAETQPSGNDRFVLYDSSATTESYRPVLSVTYTASGALRRINTSSFQQLTGGIHG